MDVSECFWQAYGLGKTGKGGIRVEQEMVNREQDFVVVRSLSHVRLFATPWAAARQASLSLTISWSLPKFMSIESVMPSNCLIVCRPLPLCLQSLPASRSFPMSWLFASSGQSTGASASASVLPMKILLEEMCPR